MPTNETPVPKLRHHKASDQVAVVIDGKWHYLGKYGTAEAREAYDRLIAEWLASGRRAPAEPGELRVGHVLTAHLRYAKQHYARPDGKPG